VWVATASPDGVAHLVPFSPAWDGVDVQFTLGRRSARVEPLADVDAGVLAALVERLGWNPADESGDWVLVSITPDRVLSWNSLGEGEGRVIMRSGTWLT